MDKYIVRINYGYGDEYEVVEADSLKDANKIAYQMWREAAESNADYEAEPYSEEKAEEYGAE